MTPDKSAQGGWGSGETSYDLFVKKEGVPLARGLWVENVLELTLGSWRRKGGRGAYINLDGSGVNTSYIAIDSYVVEIAPGGNLNAERFLYEEILYVLKGRGSTALWTSPSEKQNLEWREGSLFTIPLNARHQHFNSDKNQPARLLGCTFAPTMINLLHNDEFIFNNDFAFTDRFAGQADYFSGRGNFLDQRHFDTNFIEDIRDFSAIASRANGSSGSQGEASILYVEMGCNTMSAHLMEFPVGTYAPAHRHEPGAHILILSGQGYSLHWTEGGETVRIDWRQGSLFAPPEQWYHQHFNSGNVPAKYIAFKPRGRKFRTKGKFMNNVSQKQGGSLIDHADEDPEIRAVYERECARNGVTVNMRPIEVD